MNSQSEQLLVWFREMMDKRGISVSVLAGKSGIERKHLKKLLAGTEPMLVDELMQLSEVLEISPTDFGVAVPQAEAPAKPPSPAGTVIFDDVDADTAALLCQAGFGVGCDFMFICPSNLLADSGVPPAVLAQHAGRDLPIKMEGMYHQYNEPVWTPTTLTVKLSFDALYACTFRFDAMTRFIFWPMPIPEPPPELEEKPAKKPAGFLRLVD